MIEIILSWAYWIVAPPLCVYLFYRWLKKNMDFEEDLCRRLEAARQAGDARETEFLLELGRRHEKRGVLR